MKRNNASNNLLQLNHQKSTNSNMTSPEEVFNLEEDNTEVVQQVRPTHVCLHFVFVRIWCAVNKRTGYLASFGERVICTLWNSIAVYERTSTVRVWQQLVGLRC